MGTAGVVGVIGLGVVLIGHLIALVWATAVVRTTIKTHGKLLDGITKTQEEIVEKLHRVDKDVEVLKKSHDLERVRDR